MSLLSQLARTPKPAANSADPVKDVGLENFVPDVIEASRERIVVVDFWATWCGPCKELTPALEKVIRAYDGSVHLAKVDIDKNPEIAQQLRIQSVPAVFAFFRGQPVDGFMGAMPESQIKAWIEKLVKAVGAAGGAPALPQDTGIEFALEQAAETLASGDAQTARALYNDVLGAEPTNVTAFAGVLRSMVTLGEASKAKQMLDKAPAEIAKHKELVSVRAAIELAEQTAGAGSTSELEAKIAQNENDHQVRFDLAMALYAKGEKEPAVNQLLEIVRRSRTWNEDAARKQLVKFFEAFGSTDPLTISARKRLSSIMFS